MQKISNFDVVFCVFGCVTIEKYKNELVKLTETWGKKANNMNYKVLFFLGEEKTEFLPTSSPEILQFVGDDFIYLNGVQNDYMSASYKQNLGLKYIYEHYECKFIYICGTDTYVHIDNMKDYLSKCDHTKNISIGAGATRAVNFTDMWYFSGGGGIILSYKALSEVYPHLENMVYNWSLVPKQHLWDLSAACDVCLCFYLNLSGCEFIKENNLFFNWNYLTLDKNIIGCHEMSLLDFDDYTTIINTAPIKDRMNE